jgi:hypothetical protein
MLVMGMSAAARADELAVLAEPSPLSDWGGHVVWSAFDGGQYRLLDGVRALPVAPRPVAFDARRWT